MSCPAHAGHPVTTTGAAHPYYRGYWIIAFAETPEKLSGFGALRQTLADVSVPRPDQHTCQTHEIRNPGWNDNRLGCADRDGRRRDAARRRVPPGRGRKISSHPELWALRQGPLHAGGLQEPVAAHRQGRARRARRLDQQVSELGTVRSGEMGAPRLRAGAGG